MELSPQSVASTTFKIVKKGYDPDEVRSYLTQLATSIEQTQSQATAMEARARAAVVRLQEIAAHAPAPSPATATAPEPDHSGEADTISRTLLLAQRTADTTIAEANAEAKTITENAHTEARVAVSGAQEQVSQLIEEAKSEARRAGEGERIQVESEVQALLARREFLLSDVDYLEQYIVTQRDRLRDVAGSLTDMVEKVPGGLADLRRPLVSAAGEASFDATGGDDASDERFAPEYIDPDETMPLQRVAAASAEAEPNPTDTTDTTATTDTRETTAATNGAEDSDDTDSDDVVADDEAPSSEEETPVTGASSRFLFEDITGEVPAVHQAEADDDK